MYGKRGAQNLAQGSVGPLRLDQFGRLMGSDDLADAAISGRLFMGANQAKVATTAGLATTWTGLGLANPAGSGKNFILHEFSWGMEIASDAAGVIGLMHSTDSGLAANIAIQPACYGKGVSVGILDNGATIATPILIKALSTLGTLAVTGDRNNILSVVRLRGSIVLPPGRSLLTYTTNATTATLVFSFLWEEVPE
jgi:hypothetical protein